MHISFIKQKNTNYFILLLLTFISIAYISVFIYLNTEIDLVLIALTEDNYVLHQTVKPDKIVKLSLDIDEVLPKQVELDIPFTTQAPFGEWADPRQDYGCEEASSLMAWHWINDEPVSKQQAKQTIIDMTVWQVELDNNFYDRSAEDTTIMFKEYFGYENIEVAFDINIESIKIQLAQDKLVIVPVNGQKLDNPYFTPPGPIQHMIVIKGYDDETAEFITNDPGTRRGEGYRYSYATISRALQDYETGHGEPLPVGRTAMIVVEKKLDI